MRNFYNAENKSECWCKKSFAVKPKCGRCKYQNTFLSKTDKQGLVFLFIGIVLINARGFLGKTYKRYCT